MMNIKYLTLHYKPVTLGIIAVILTYVFFPTRPHYKEITIQTITPASVKLDSIRLNIFDEEKKNKITYRLLQHDYIEQVLNFNANFFLFFKKNSKY